MACEKDAPSLSGALDGFQIGYVRESALKAAGAIGTAAGAALGIVGGIFGSRQQRRESHKEAAARWERLRPQYEALYSPKRSLTKATDPVKAARRSKVKAARKASRVTKRRAK